MDMLRGPRREELLRLAERHGVSSVRVFGSVARGEANETSDLDLLVDWESGRSLLDHVALVQDLEETFGVKVHIATGYISTTCWTAVGASHVSSVRAKTVPGIG